MATKVGVYKGHPIFEVHESADCSDKFPVSLGVKKIRAIVENLAAAQKFLADSEAVGAQAPSINLGL